MVRNNCYSCNIFPCTQDQWVSFSNKDLSKKSAWSRKASQPTRIWNQNVSCKKRLLLIWEWGWLHLLLSGGLRSLFMGLFACPQQTKRGRKREIFSRGCFPAQLSSVFMIIPVVLWWSVPESTICVQVHEPLWNVCTHNVTHRHSQRAYNPQHTQKRTHSNSVILLCPSMIDAYVRIFRVQPYQAALHVSWTWHG